MKWLKNHNLQGLRQRVSIFNDVLLDQLGKVDYEIEGLKSTGSLEKTDAFRRRDLLEILEHEFVHIFDLSNEWTIKP